MLYSNSTNDKKLFEIYSLTYSQLLSLGVHIGHTIVNSEFYSSWMVYGYRRNLLIINMHKFVNMFRIGFMFFDKAVSTRSPIWFVGKDKTFSNSLRIAALDCGEFSCTADWINGLISNFFVIFRSLSKFSKVSVELRPHKYFSLNFKDWILTRFSWPRVIFVSCVSNNYVVANEASSLKVPCIGIVDTNALSHLASIAVPGNDDSIFTSIFYNEMVSSFIMYRKSAYVLLWFSSVRRNSRMLSFIEWFKYKHSKLSFKSKRFSNLKLSFSDFNSRFNMLARLGKLSMRFFFSENVSWLRAFDFDMGLYMLEDVSLEKFNLLRSFKLSQSNIVISNNIDMLRNTILNRNYSKKLFSKILSSRKKRIRRKKYGLSKWGWWFKKRSYFKLKSRFSRDVIKFNNIEYMTKRFIKKGWKKAFRCYRQFSKSKCKSRILRKFFNFFFYLYWYKGYHNKKFLWTRTISKGAFWKKFFYKSKKWFFFFVALRLGKFHKQVLKNAFIRRKNFLKNSSVDLSGSYSGSYFTSQQKILENFYERKFIDRSLSRKYIYSLNFLNRLEGLDFLKTYESPKKDKFLFSFIRAKKIRKKYIPFRSLSNNNYNTRLKKRNSYKNFNFILSKRSYLLFVQKTAKFIFGGFKFSSNALLHLNIDPFFWAMAFAPIYHSFFRTRDFFVISAGWNILYNKQTVSLVKKHFNSNLGLGTIFSKSGSYINKKGTLIGSKSKIRWRFYNDFEYLNKFGLIEAKPFKILKNMQNKAFGKKVKVGWLSKSKSVAILKKIKSINKNLYTEDVVKFSKRYLEQKIIISKKFKKFNKYKKFILKKKFNRKNRQNVYKNFNFKAKAFLNNGKKKI